MRDTGSIRNKFQSFKNHYRFHYRIGSLDNFTLNEVNEVTIAIQNFLDNEIREKDLILILKNKQILLEDERNIVNFGWQSSLFLRMLKN